MIEGDPSRSAVPAIRGYEYQFWRTVLAWVQLGSDEELIVEVAEDLAITGEGDACAVQVKATKQALTLNNPAARQALASFLDLKERNPNVRLRFRFVTTAQPGIEKGHPFGKDMPGILLWEHCRVARDLGWAARIGEVLLAEDETPSSLRAFLEASDPGQILQNLISPFEWQAGSGNTGEAQQRVAEMLVIHGESWGVRPAAATAVAHRLLDEVLRTAARESPSERRLTRARFLTLFEDATSESVPAGELAVLRRLQRSLVTSIASSPGIEIALDDFLRPGATGYGSNLPPISFPHARRRALEKQSMRKLQEKGLVLLKGPVGVGKSVLASLVAREVAGSRAWISCSPPFSQRRWRDFLAVMPGFPRQTTWVIDDLDLEDVAAEPQGLAWVVAAARERGDWLLITATSSPGERLCTVLGFDMAAEVAVQEFDSEEAATLASVLGCPAELQEAWVSIGMAATAGHPQLLHAFFLALRREGWPASSATPVVAVSAERVAARRLLLDTTSHRVAELLAGLSAYGGVFRREHALAIGEDLALSSSGSLFDSLGGPYISQEGDGYFRLSPLLADMASSAWTGERLRKVQAAVGAAVVRCQPQTLVEASQLLALGMAAGLDELVSSIVVSLLGAPENRQASLARWLSWLVHAEPNSTELSVESSYLVDWLRFRIAVQVAPHECERILKSWEATARAAPPPRRDFLLCGIAGSVIATPGRMLGIQSRLRFLAEEARLAAEHPETARFLEESSEQVWPDVVKRPGDHLALQFLLVAYHCTVADDVQALIDGLCALPQQTRETLLRFCAGTGAERATFIDAAWRGEVKSASPDWEKALAILERTAEMAERWGATALYTTAMAGSAVIHSEYLRDFARAEAVLARAETVVGAVPILEDQRAMVRFVQGDYASALEILERLLPRWELPAASGASLEVGATGQVFSFRIAGIAAAMLERWRDSGYWFGAGAARVPNALGASFRAGFQADAGYGYWRAGEPATAVRFLRDAVASLDQAAEQGERDAGVAAKLVGHVLLWIEAVVNNANVDLLTPVIAGMCSDPARHPALGELVPTPVDLCWLHASRIERALTGSFRTLDEVSSRLLDSAFGVVRELARESLIERDFDRQLLETLPADALGYAKEFLANRDARQRGHEICDPLPRPSGSVTELPFERDLFAAGLLVYAAHSGVEDAKQLIARWGESEAYAEVPGLDSWILTARRLLGEPDEARSIITGKSAERDERLLAAVVVAVAGRAPPEARFVAHGTLFDVYSQGPWSRHVAGPLAAVVTRDWQEIVHTPAALRTPRLAVPLLLDAIARPGAGYTKVADILLAAQSAVNVRVPSALRERLRAHLPERSRVG